MAEPIPAEPEPERAAGRDSSPGPRLSQKLVTASREAQPIRSGWRQYAIAVGAFAGTSLLNWLLQPGIGADAAALVYLLSVVLLALVVGRGPILLGTALTAVGWSFLFAEPRYSFHIAGFYDKMMVATYFLVALIISQLTARLRAERLAEQQREQHSTALYLFTRELAAAADLPDTLGKIVRQVGQTLGTEVGLWLPDPARSGALVAYPAATWHPSESEQRTAVQTYAGNQPAGPGLGQSPDAQALYLPLSAGGPPAGVLGLKLQANSGWSRQQVELADHFARQITIALDRQRLRDAEINSRLLAESERLGRTLLNSVSHELRTPLSAITGAANTLRSSGPLSAVQNKLTLEIESAAARLNRVVQSLLSAARLQSGQLRPDIDWCDISELVHATLRNLGNLLEGHSVERRLAPGLPLVRADSVLLEQALGNLLANAAIHTPPGTPIEISARLEGTELVVEVADRGPGLPPEQVERIFDLFQRPPTVKPGGMGLGLAIVKGFVEAQGGRVRAANRPDAGARFEIRLPAAEAPPLPDESA